MKLTLTTVLLAALSMAVVTGSAEELALTEQLKRVLPPNSDVSNVQPTPVPGIYEVTVGSRTFYAHSNGEFLLVGDMFDLNRNVNLADERRGERMKVAIAEIPESRMIVMGPEDPKRVITVFTDVDCGYCRKLHRDVPALNEAGLQVRYLMFPRAGLGSKSYHTSVSVWCAEDRVDAITRAKLGQAIEPKTCENPVAEHYKLGQEVGIRGTPTLIMDDGRIVPGYLPPLALLAELGISPNE